MSNYIIRPNRHIFNISDIKELFRFKDLFYVLADKDIKIRYKQTVLGIAWVLFQPLISTVIFTMLFSRFVNLPSGSLPYPVFAYIGLVFWTYFSNSVTTLSGSLIASEGILKKVYFPRLIAPLSSLMANILDFGVSTALLFIFFVIFRVIPTPMFFIWYVLGFVVITLTVLGLGMFLAAANVKYRDVRYVLPFVIQLMIFLTPVFYPLTIVSEEKRLILAANPLTTVIETIRGSLSVNYVHYPLFWTVSLFSMTIVFVVGYWYFKKTENYFADIL